jgi:hypothetical protein
MSTRQRYYCTPEQDAAHDIGESCDVDLCQECCQHDERDHGICLDCGHEQDPGEAIDQAQDGLEDR